LLLDKLPEVLTHAQKLNRIHNLLRQLAETGRIVNSGSAAAGIEEVMRDAGRSAAVRGWQTTPNWA
jgi:hypothetical protein